MEPVSKMVLTISACVMLALKGKSVKLILMNVKIISAKIMQLALMPPQQFLTQLRTSQNLTPVSVQMGFMENIAS